MSMARTTPAQNPRGDASNTFPSAPLLPFISPQMIFSASGYSKVFSPFVRLGRRAIRVLQFLGANKLRPDAGAAILLVRVRARQSHYGSDQDGGAKQLN